MTRRVHKIIIHCTATYPDAEVADIVNYWKEHLGWKSPGYHFVIDAMGEVTQLLELSKIANGAKGFNHESIHVSYIGGKLADGSYGDTRTEAQEIALEGIVKSLHAVFPRAEILGHRDLPNVAKLCPCFEVREFLEDIQLWK